MWLQVYFLAKIVRIYGYLTKLYKNVHFLCLLDNSSLEFKNML